jgi:predicted membrane protein
MKNKSLILNTFLLIILLIFSIFYYFNNEKNNKQESKKLENKIVSKNKEINIKEINNEILKCKYISKRDFNWSGCQISSNWNES